MLVCLETKCLWVQDLLQSLKRLFKECNCQYVSLTSPPCLVITSVKIVICHFLFGFRFQAFCVFIFVHYYIYICKTYERYSWYNYLFLLKKHYNSNINILIFPSRQWEVFWSKSYSKDFHKNIGNYLVRWRPFYFNKIASPKAATFIKMFFYFYNGIFLEFY